MSAFLEMLRAVWARNDSLVCVGLDPEPERFPAAFAHRPDAIFEFCRAIVDATSAATPCAHTVAHAWNASGNPATGQD